MFIKQLCHTVAYHYIAFTVTLSVKYQRSMLGVYKMTFHSVFLGMEYSRTLPSSTDAGSAGVFIKSSLDVTIRNDLDISIPGLKFRVQKC